MERDVTNGVFLLYLTFCLKFKQQYLNFMYASLKTFVMKFLIG